MKEKIAKEIVRIAEKAAYKNVGKSTILGTYEIKPPEELLKKKECNKK